MKWVSDVFRYCLCSAWSWKESTASLLCVRTGHEALVLPTVLSDSRDHLPFNSASSSTWQNIISFDLIPSSIPWIAGSPQSGSPGSLLKKLPISSIRAGSPPLSHFIGVITERLPLFLLVYRLGKTLSFSFPSSSQILWAWLSSFPQVGSATPTPWSKTKG